MDESIRDSERLTIERHKHRHRNIRKKLYCATQEGVEVAAKVFLQPLVVFLKDPDNPFGLHSDNPVGPLPQLKERLTRIPDHYEHVALAILAPVLDGIARNREDDDQALIINRKGVASLTYRRPNDELPQREAARPRSIFQSPQPQRWPGPQCEGGATCHMIPASYPRRQN
jgi:hypothetical protein